MRESSVYKPNRKIIFRRRKTSLNKSVKEKSSEREKIRKKLVKDFMLHLGIAGIVWGAILSVIIYSSVDTFFPEFPFTFLIPIVIIILSVRFFIKRHTPEEGLTLGFLEDYFKYNIQRKYGKSHMKSYNGNHCNNQNSQIIDDRSRSDTPSSIQTNALDENDPMINRTSVYQNDFGPIYNQTKNDRGLMDPMNPLSMNPISPFYYINNTYTGIDNSYISTDCNNPWRD